MRISFNVQAEISNDLLIQVIAVMQIQDIKVTKKSLKDFIEFNLKDKGRNFLDYGVWEDYKNGPLTYPQTMGAWALANGMVKGGIDIPQPPATTAEVS